MPDFPMPSRAAPIPAAEPPGFFDNLAATVDDYALHQIGTDLMRQIERDDAGRQKWMEIYDRALKQTGFERAADNRSQDGDGGVATVANPLVARAMVETSARLIKELCPPGGSTRTQIVGPSTPLKREAANRIRDYMNWQQTEQMAPDWRDAYDQMLPQMCLIGSGFLKLYAGADRPMIEVVNAKDLIVPYLASSLGDAARVSHRFAIDGLTYDERVASGLYVDAVPQGSTWGMAGLDDKPQERLDSIAGVEKPDENHDDIRILCECQTRIDMDVLDPLADGPAPYIVTMEWDSGAVVALRRNWHPDDPRQKALQWFSHYRFMPWDGFYGCGLYQLIGGLDRAATVALRTLLKAGTRTVAGGGVYLRNALSSRIGAGQITKDPFTYTGIDSDATDIRQVFMQMGDQATAMAMGPLFQVLGFIHDNGAAFTQVIEDFGPGATADIPVGTMAMLVENGSQVYSAIHARAFAAQRETLRILSRLNRDTLPEGTMPQPVDASPPIMAQDFSDAVDVLPVADPHIFAEAQRALQQQAVAAAAQQYPQFFDQNAVIRRGLEALRIPNLDEIMPPQPKAAQLDPASENVAPLTGMPIAPQQGQDHLAHLQAHLAFINDPNLGLSPLLAPVVVPPLVDHIRKTIGLWYLNTIGQSVEQEGGPGIGPTLPASLEPDVSRMIATLSPLVSKAAAEVLTQVGPICANAMQAAAAGQPQTPPDPAIVAAQAADAETKRKAGADQMKHADEQAVIAQKAEESVQDNRTAIEIAQMKIDAGGAPGNFTTGNSIR